MPANLRQTVLTALEQYPAARVSYNALVFTYWLIIDGYGTTEKDFAKLTPLESICREARTIWSQRPDLSPTANASQDAELFATP